ncbi:TPA: conjugal transfer protein, partial [Clostridioides difficile]
NVKEKKVRTVKVGTHKKSVIALWVVLIASVSFGVYKNFTAIDMHTVHETETIQLRLTDTNGIENFVKNFAKSYYTWNNSKEAIEARTQAISGYLTKELQALNTDTIRKDIPVSSAVNGVQIWSVTQADENQFSVIFTVEQLITENGSTKTVRSAYEVTVYVDGSGNMVLTKNPTITSIPVKSGYTPKAKESDGTVDAVTTDEINEFLTTFFKLYPTATAKELSYYVNEGVLKPIGKDYVFSELVNPIYNRIDSQVTVSVAVKYLDQQTKATQVSQFDLVLEKSGSNWKIIK